MTKLEEIGEPGSEPQKKINTRAAVIRKMILSGESIDEPSPDQKLTIDEARRAGFTEQELRLGLLRGFVLPANETQPIVNWDLNAHIEGRPGLTIGVLERTTFAVVSACLKSGGILPPNFRKGKKKELR